MLEKENKAAIYLLNYFNGQVSYFSNLLNKYKDTNQTEEWIIESYKMTVRLNRDNVEKIEKWIKKQKFNYD